MTDTHKRLALLVGVVAVILRLVFVFLTPAWQAPDEYAHYWVAEQIAITGQSPTGNHTWPNYEAYQPPLYYWAASAIIKPFDLPVSFSPLPVSPPPSLIALRLFSVLLFAASYWFAYRLLKRFRSLEPGEIVWSLAFLAVLPTFVGNGAAVTNDGLVVVLSVACCVLAWTPNWSARTSLSVGFLAGLALLAKWNAVILVPIVIWRIWPPADGDSKAAFRHLCLAAGGWLLPVLLLLGRNLIQYHDLLALNPGAVGGFGLTLGNVVRAVRNMTWSFWLAFGADYKTTPGPVVYLVTALPLMLAALAGWFRKGSRHTGAGLGWIFSVGVAVLASLTFTMCYPPGEMTSWGKNLFVVLPFAAILAVVGWTRLYRRRPWLIPSIATALMLAGCCWGLWRLHGMTAG